MEHGVEPFGGIFNHEVEYAERTDVCQPFG
jgi:hypothetical protein